MRYGEERSEVTRVTEPMIDPERVGESVGDGFDAGLAALEPDVDIDPGRVTEVVADRLGEGGRLAETGRGDHRRHRSRPTPGERVDEAPTDGLVIDRT